MPRTFTDLSAANESIEAAAPKKRPTTAWAIVCICFFLKFAIYGVFITPLWDIPDESGHFSYVEDIVDGKIPVLGSSKMGVDVTHSWIAPSAKPGLNWIAQHPPLYYSIAAPVLMTARATGLSFDAQVRSVRLVSALFGTLALLGIMLVIWEVTRNGMLALAGAIFVGCTPMFLQLGTGVSHDTLVACMAAWAAFWCIRWLETDNFVHALWCALFVALGLVTKFTGLGMAIPLFFAMAYRLWITRPVESPMTALRRCTVLWLVMFLPICLWMLRNFVLVHQLLPVTSIITKAHPKVSIGFLEYALNTPFWPSTLINYVGLIGWNGRGNGVLDWVQASGPILRYFLAAIFFCATLTLVRACNHWRGRLANRTVVLLSAFTTVCAAGILQTDKLSGLTCIVLALALLATIVRHLPAALRGERKPWLFVTGSICALFFSFVFYEHLWAEYNGVVRATHGRYFYPVLPFLIVILAWPLRGIKLTRVALFASLLAMLFSDRFFLHQALRLYGQL